MGNLMLQARDKANQIRVRGIPMKVIKKLVNVFITKKQIYWKRLLVKNKNLNVPIYFHYKKYDHIKKDCCNKNHINQNKIFYLWHLMKNILDLFDFWIVDGYSN